MDTAQTEFDTAGETGGEKTHTLTSAQMPIHTHTQNAHTHTQDAHAHVERGLANTIGSGNNHLVTSVNSSTSGGTQTLLESTANTTAANQNSIATNNNTGGGEAHNILQPYITVYFWKRTV